MGLKATELRSRENDPVNTGEGARAEHYFTADPSTPARETEVLFEVADREYRLTAGGGVFSATRLDPGTAVLLRKAELPGPATEGALLDVGCGYGPIACVLATMAPRATVYATDVNVRALELTRANAAALGVAVEAREPDAIPSAVSFRQIWSNPPIRIGKAELHALLLRWLPRLSHPDGVAWLVVARHLGADSLAAWLGEQGYGVVRHASQQGFRVLRVWRNSGDERGASPQNL
jgi:16S rRNA G1207 methylase RsmC